MTKKTVELSSAYVEPDEVVLDPTKLDDSVLDRMPQPTGWKILVLPYRGKGVNKRRNPSHKRITRQRNNWQQL